MKCVKCGSQAVIDTRRHNAGFCGEHFVEHVHRQVERAISSYRMFTRNDRLLVAVSGGKDSLALWEILDTLGFRAEGLHLHLDIEGYSDRSLGAVEAFAEKHGLRLHRILAGEDAGFSVPALARKVRTEPCAVCGTMKRYLFNRFARKLGLEMILTGHNLDDEAATLLGNVLHWQMGYLGRQYQVLWPKGGLPGKAKPLIRMTEREIAAYTVLRDIEYLVEDCPLSGGATSLNYKQALNGLENLSPGTKHHFLMGFYKRGRVHFQGDDPHLSACESCGEPTTGRICSFCRLLERAEKQSSKP